MDNLISTKRAGGVAYFIRHGSTLLNDEGGQDKIRGHLDVPLSDVGVKEAWEVAHKLSRHPISHVMSSDLIRARHTGNAVAALHSLGSAEPTHFLRPWNLGDMQGKSSADAAQKVPHYIENPDEPVPGGESFNDFKNRYAQGVNEVVRRMDGGQHVAVATHYRNLALLKAYLNAGGDWDKVNTKDLFTKDPLIPPGSVHVLRRS